MRQELVDPGAHLRLFLAAEDAVCGQPVVAQLTDAPGRGAGEDVGHVGGAEATAQLGDGLHDSRGHA